MVSLTVENDAALRVAAIREFERRNGPSCRQLRVEWSDVEVGVGIGTVTGYCDGVLVSENVTVHAGPVETTP